MKTLRNTLLITLCACAMSFTYAQDGDSRVPASGDIGMTVGFNNPFTNVTPFSSPIPVAGFNTLMFRYYFADNMAARVGLLFSNTSSTTEVDTFGGPGVLVTNETKNTTFGISVGAQMNMVASDRVNAYGGLDILFTSGSSDNTTTTDILSPTGIGTFSSTAIGDQMVVATPGAPSSSFGVRLVAGFEYFFAKSISVGGEFGWGFLSTSSKAADASTVTTVIGAVTTTTTTKPIGTTKSSTMGVMATGQFNISIYFTK